MKFDMNGNRIPPRAPEMKRTPAYWFESEMVDERGYCDEPFPCETVESISHLCGRYSGHTGNHAAAHVRTAGGRMEKTVEKA